MATEEMIAQAQEFVELAKVYDCGSFITTDTIPELMADFTESQLKAERIRIATELEEQILCSASTSTHIDLAYYIEKLKGGSE